MNRFEERLKSMIDTSNVIAQPVKDGGRLVQSMEERENFHNIRSLRSSFGFVKFKDLESKRRFLEPPLRIFGMTPSPTMHFKLDDADFKTTLIVDNLPKLYPLHQFITLINFHLTKENLPVFEATQEIRNIVVSTNRIYLTFENFEQAMRACLLLNQLEFSGKGLVATFLEGPLRYIAGQTFEDLDFLNDDYRQLKLKQADTRVKERLSLLPENDFLRISERAANEKNNRVGGESEMWLPGDRDIHNPFDRSGLKIDIKKGDTFSKMVEFVTHIVDLQQEIGAKADKREETDSLVSLIENSKTSEKWSKEKKEANTKTEKSTQTSTEANMALFKESNSKSNFETNSESNSENEIKETSETNSENEIKETSESNSEVRIKSRSEQESDFCDRFGGFSNIKNEKDLKQELENWEVKNENFKILNTITMEEFDELFVGIETKKRRNFR